MATTTISISEAAYRRLKRLKGPGESFSDVLLRELPEPCETCGEVLDRLQQNPVPSASPRLRAAMLAGRGRRSFRKRP
jgi:predicted CopG family antitoxin